MERSNDENFFIYRRHLPHWRKDYAYYFVTWRVDKSASRLSENEKSFVSQSIEYFQGVRYSVFAYVVMDDHVHVVLTLKDEFRLDQIIHSWKSFTANQFQRLTGRSG